MTSTDRCTRSPWTATGSAGHCVLRRPLAGRAAGRDGGLVATDTAPRSPRLEELVAGATDRVEVRTSDAKSGARFERLVIDGERHFLKVAVGRRTTGSCGSPATPPTGSSRSGRPGSTASSRRHRPHDRRDGPRGDRSVGRLSILMTDCGDDLVPPGDDPCRRSTTPTSSTTWPRCTRTSWAGTTTSACRTCPVACSSSRPRRSRPSSRWPTCRSRSRSRTRAGRCCPSGRPASTSWSGPCTATPTRSSTRCGPRPLTFVAGDWKLGNVGRRPDGRTILLDWAYPGEAAAVLGPDLVPRAQPGPAAR